MCESVCRSLRHNISRRMDEQTRLTPLREPEEKREEKRPGMGIWQLVQGLVGRIED